MMERSPVKAKPGRFEMRKARKKTAKRTTKRVVRRTGKVTKIIKPSKLTKEEMQKIAFWNAEIKALDFEGQNLEKEMQLAVYQFNAEQHNRQQNLANKAVAMEQKQQLRDAYVKELGEKRGIDLEKVGWNLTTGKITPLPG
jgi:hypothetical protein